MYYRNFRIPDKDHIEGISVRDPVWAHYNHMRFFFAWRIHQVLMHLGAERFDRILEVGYASGVLFPELMTRCRRLVGIDIHQNFAPVKRMMELERIKADIFSGSITELPYKNETFDCVVSLSTIEHIADYDKAVAELERVLTPGGLLVLGMPVKNVFTDKLIPFVAKDKIDINDVHPTDQHMVMSSLKKHFGPFEKFTIPNFLPNIDWTLYATFRTRKPW